VDKVLYVFAFMALLLIANSALLRATKVIRGKRGALTNKVNLDDLLILMAVGAVTSIFVFVGNTFLTFSAACLLGLYGVLVWLDAILFVQYRIEINRQTIAWFFTGTNGLGKGIPHLLALFKQYPIAALIPLVWLGGVWAAYSLGNIQHFESLYNIAKFALCSIMLSVLCVYFPRVNVYGVSATLLCMLSFLSVAVPATTGSVSQAVIWFAAVAFILVSALLLLLTLLRKLFNNQHEFLTSPTLLSNILAVDNFVADDGVILNTQHEDFVKPAAKSQSKSEYFGTCAGANVILITVESLGAYISPYITDGARSRLSEKLASKSWFSKQHFCLCPNTTVSTNQIYTGAYSNNPYNKLDSLFPGQEPKHIKALKQEGYKTLFLDSANINLFDYKKLLKRIGFDRVWGTEDIPEHGLKADYRLWNMVDVIAKEVADSPFYLHLINDQTHMPYEVVDKQRFSNHKGASQKSLYLNALEEVDYILDVFLQKLAEKIDLSNTILVFTGDHGESFGEFGYSFHSNSVIMPQMQVPFMLHHPKLSPRQINHSCHFDLFPTFFDLLGIDFQHKCIGNSIGIEDRRFAYFFHSATLKGNTPANFGSLYDGEMFWVDRLFNQVNVLHNDQIKSNLNGADKEYISSMLNRMLIQRGLLS
jgi:uncharacterized membrane protein